MPAPRQFGPMHPAKRPRVEVYWTAVTYRAVIIYCTIFAGLVMTTFYVIHPDWYSKIADRMSRTLGATSTVADLSQNQARFVNLDGKVEVKKVNSVNWETADYRVTLDKGDLVRTA